MIATEPLSIQQSAETCGRPSCVAPRTLGGRHVILTEEIRVVD